MFDFSEFRSISQPHVVRIYSLKPVTGHINRSGADEGKSHYSIFCHFYFLICKTHNIAGNQNMHPCLDANILPNMMNNLLLKLVSLVELGHYSSFLESLAKTYVPFSLLWRNKFSITKNTYFSGKVSCEDI